MLKITNLNAQIEGKSILNGIDLEVKSGEVHAIMGPNGSGKSTLTQVLAGKPGYEITAGEIKYFDKDLLDLETEERAREGIFLAFQYPVAIPGVNNAQFLRTSVNQLRKHNGESEMSAAEFFQLSKEMMKGIEMNPELLKRSLNDGFSGGEKKKNEILQLLMLNPKLAILDETDSGLDIDALNSVARGVNHYRNSNNAVLLITHYQRLLDLIEPDIVHVLVNGKIIKSGDKNLALKLEEKGYDWIKEITHV